MEERSQQPIIIKKKKKGHEAHHGGAWKVAYADFVTAMMAFFLVMWLLAAVSPEKRASVSQYFQHYNIFQESGSSAMFKESGASLRKNPVPLMSQNNKGMKISPPFPAKEGAGGHLNSEDFANKLKSAIDEKLKSIKNQVLVDIVEGGVRVQIIDAEGSMMFPSAVRSQRKNPRKY